MSPSRRHFLRSAGGLALAIPFLPSMAGRRGFAGARGSGAPRLFIAMATHHGGVWGENMFPDDATLSTAGSYAGRQLRAGALVGRVQGGQRVLSPVLRADSHRLTERLAGQLSVLRGLDVPWYIAHHTGGHLGNFARNDGNGAEGVDMQDQHTPTIDQILGWSDRFYGDPDSIVERVMVVGSGRLSYNYASPAARAGQIQAQPSYTSSLQLFQRVFDPAAAFGAASPLVVDRVLESYRSLRADSQLSAGDLRRLDAHIERLYDVQRRLNMEISCAPEAPSEDAEALHEDPAYFRDPAAQARYWQMMNDVVVAAMSCGVSRVASMHITDTLSDFAGDWHQDIAHQAYLADGEAQQVIADAHQRFFEGVFLDLVEKLDATAGAGGGSLLDDALVVWTQESGQLTHESYSVPVIAAGSAGGAIQAGQYIDYRDRSVELVLDDDGVLSEHPGLVWNQYLGTVLQVMGLSPTEYETDPAGGYGLLFVSDERPFYDDAVSVVGDSLPLWT